jgi:hypothetical protein
MDILPTGHQAVHQVIAGGNALEHGLNSRGPPVIFSSK